MDKARKPALGDTKEENYPDRSVPLNCIVRVQWTSNTSMCIAAFVWQAHPLYPLLLLQNRDEYHNRPTKPVEWWDGDCSDILAGRDEVAGGTWLACSRTGRVAFLTNVLELHTLAEAKSRGDLPVRFLQSTNSPKEFASELVKEVHLYNGFNLILADIPSKSMVYISNRPKGEPVIIQEVPPGIHVLTNAKLDSPWHKAMRLGLNFKQFLDKHEEQEIPAKEMVEKLMRDRLKADKSRLPGVYPPGFEIHLTSIFIEVDTPLGLFGTRSTIALAVRPSGEVSFYETYLENDTWKERTVEYQIHQKPKLKKINN